MKPSTFLATALVVSASILAGCTPLKTTSATSAAKKLSYAQKAAMYLPGVWKYDYEFLPKMYLKGTSTYYPNGTADYDAKITMRGRSVSTVKLSATWKVTGNQITTVVTKTNNPKMVPMGYTSTDTINKLNAKIFSYTSEEDKITIVETRVKPL